MVSALTLVFVMATTWFTWRAYDRLSVHRFDLGNVEQVVWNVTHGHGFVMTDPYGTATVSRFAFHIDPLLLVFVPPYAVFPFAKTIILVQILFVASGIWATYLLGRLILSERLGLLMAASYAVLPSVLWATIFPVHAVTVAMPLVMWLMYTAMTRRWWWMLALLVLVLSAKEQVGFSLVVFGAWLWRSRREFRMGLLVMIVSVCWASIATFVVLPQYRPQTQSAAEVYSSVLGASGSEIIASAVADPVRAAHVLVNKRTITTNVKLFLGNGGLAVLNPLSLAAVPDIIINGISNKVQQHDLKFHYQSMMVPWLLVAAMLSWVWIERRTPSSMRRWARAILVIWWCACSVASLYAFGPLPGTPNDRLRFATWRNRYTDMVRDWSRRIPSTARVSATNSVGAWFAGREHLYLFALEVSDAEYVVSLANSGPNPDQTQVAIQARITELQSSGAWETLASDGDFTVLRRRP